MVLELFLFWVISLASASHASDIKVTTFTLEHSSGATEDPREIIRCAELCARKICSSFVCKLGYCQLCQRTANCGSSENKGYNYRKVVDHETKTIHRQTPLLFVYPIHWDSQLRIQQMDIGEWSPTFYPLHVKNINAVVYIPWTQELWVASAATDRVKVYPLFKQKVKSVIRGVSVLRFAVDEESKLVFMSTRSPRQTVSRVEGDGSGLVTVYKKKRVTVFDISADPAKRRLYISIKRNRKYKVTSINYHGKHARDLLTDSKRILFSFDKERKLLYYSTGNSLNKLFVERNSRLKLKTFASRLVTIFYYLDNVYLRLKTRWTQRYGTITKKSAFIKNKYMGIKAKILKFCVVS